MSTLTIAIALWSGTAAGAPTAADRESARELMIQADSLFEKKEYREALKRYEAAHQLMNVPTTGLAMAQAHAALGNLIEARDFALQVGRIPKEPGERKALKRARDQAAQLAESLRGRIPSIAFALEGLEEGKTAEIRIDGTVLPPALAGLPRKVNPGKHTIAAHAAGYQDASQEVTVAEGDTKKVTLTMIQGGETTGTPSPTEVGGLQPPPDTGPSESGGISPWVYVGFGVGGAGLIAGTITGVISLGKASDAKDQCVDNVCRTQEAADAADSSKTFGTVSNISFGVGIAGVAVGVVALLVGGGSSSETATDTSSHVKLTPVVGAGNLGLHGTF